MAICSLVVSYSPAFESLMHASHSISVLQTTANIEAKAERISSQLETKDYADTLEWITRADYARQQSDHIARRQEGTGQWLLDSKEFQAWVKTSKQTLFCPGIPGAGKTILTSIVVQNLFARFKNEQGVGIAYVYCNFRLQDEQRAQDLLASLLKQLTQKQSSLPEAVKSLYKNHKDGTRLSFDEVSRTLHTVAALYSRVFIIVDALDECQPSNNRSRFLTEILALQSKCGANIFTTSRFIPEITSRFRDSKLVEIRASNADVERYLQGHMGHLPSFVRRNQQLQDEIKIKISESVDGMYVVKFTLAVHVADFGHRFLLAQIYLKSLEDKTTVKAIKNALNQFQKLYQGSNEEQKLEVLGRAYDDAMKRIHTQELGFRELAREVLAWITCAKRPLSTSQLRQALAVEIGEPELDEENLPDVEQMVSVCAGLVTVDKKSKIIRLAHYTTQEYFERTQWQWFPHAETSITEICVTFLSFSVFETGFCRTDEEFEERLWLNPFYSYAARYWGHHAHEASTLSNYTMHFLGCMAKVNAATQAMVVDGSRPSITGYSQNFPKQVHGLHLAAYFGLANAMGVFLESVDPNLNDGQGQTPISLATAHGHIAIVELLVDKGADFTSEVVLWPQYVYKIRENYFSRTPLSIAAERGHVSIVKLLAAHGADYGTITGPYGTALHAAAANGHKDVVKLLLDLGADVNTPLPEPPSPALVVDGFTIYILDIGVGVGVDDRECSVLQFAALSGHSDVVNLLLGRGADVNAAFGYYGTALEAACSGGHIGVVKQLLANGARVNEKLGYFGSALQAASNGGHGHIVRFLLNNGADVNLRNGHLGTALHAAALGAHEGVVRLLLKNGADVNALFGYYGAALHAAAMADHRSVVILLLNAGANIDAVAGHYGTALQGASRLGLTEVVQLLVDRGANVNIVAGHYETALHAAKSEGHGGIAKLLLEKGATENLHESRDRSVPIKDRQTCSMCLEKWPWLS